MDLNDLQALMGESLEAADYGGVWVIDAPATEAASARGAGPQLLGEARRLADALGAYVHYVGPAEAGEAIALGADRVHALASESPEPAVATLAAFFDLHKPEFALLPATPLGDELAGRLAQRLSGGHVLDCIALRLNEATREIVVTHPVYEGAYYLDTAIVRKPAFVTVRPGTLAAPFRDAGRSGEEEAVPVAPAPGRVRALGRIDYTPPAVPLRKAARVVAVGRWGNDADSISAARALASKIGAHFGGDRSAFDAGWIEREQIVGVVGTQVAPDLYVAAGIWGDTLHRAGIEAAKMVVAIHPDPKAPIFTYADACLVAKPKEVLPKLLALL